MQGSPSWIAAVVLVGLGAWLGGGCCPRAPHPHLPPQHAGLETHTHTHIGQTHGQKDLINAAYFKYRWLLYNAVPCAFRATVDSSGGKDVQKS